MIKGKSKTTIVGMIILIIVLGTVAGFVFIKFKDEKSFATFYKIGDNPTSQGLITNDDSQNNTLDQELLPEEKANIENYINEICNNYFDLGRLPQFDDINKADKNWIYGHLTFEEDSFLSKDEIENELKSLFGNNFNINLINDEEALKNNKIYYNDEKGQYELFPYGSDMNIYYIINSVKKTNQEYIVNVIEYAQIDDVVIGKYLDTRY